MDVFTNTPDVAADGSATIVLHIPADWPIDEEHGVALTVRCAFGDSSVYASGAESVPMLPAD